MYFERLGIARTVDSWKRTDSVTEHAETNSAPNVRWLPLDGLRGIAIILVVMVHTVHYDGPLFVGRFVEEFARFGWVGVTLFFVLSGFLISGILLDTLPKSNSMRDFYARRCLRILPVYIAFLLFHFFVVPRVPYLDYRIPQPSSGMHVYYWSFTSNMKESLSGISEWISSLDQVWSLAVEEQVYLVWPFLILMIRKNNPIWVLLAIALLSMGWRLWTRITWQPIELSYNWTFANLEAFSVGAIVAVLYRRTPEKCFRVSVMTTFVSGCVLVGIVATLGHFDFWKAFFPVLTLGSTAMTLFFGGIIGMCISIRQDSLLNRGLSFSVFRFFGKYSYAIYLFHASVVVVLRPLVISTGNGDYVHDSLLREMLLLMLVNAVSMAVAIASWHWIELPFLRLKHYFPQSRLGQPTSQSARRSRS